MDQKLATPQKKTHAKFPSLKNFQKPNKFGCTLLAELQGWDTQALTQIFRLFWILKKYLPNISTQKILASKIQTKKILWSSLPLEILGTAFLQ